MKHLPKKVVVPVLTTGAAVAVLSVSGLAANRYQTYQNHQTQAAKATASAQQVKLSALEGINTTLTATNANLRAECEKGMSAYAQLKTLTKSPKLQAPNCQTK